MRVKFSNVQIKPCFPTNNQLLKDESRQHAHTAIFPTGKHSAKSEKKINKRCACVESAHSPEDGRPLIAGFWGHGDLQTLEMQVRNTLNLTERSTHTLTVCFFKKQSLESEEKVFPGFLLLITQTFLSLFSQANLRLSISFVQKWVTT
jgi:hypothetical protein